MTSKTYVIYVGTAAVPLCANNPKRTNLKVFNTASNTVYVISEQSQPYTEGYPVTATIPYENKECKQRMWIIAATGTNDVRVQVDSE